MAGLNDLLYMLKMNFVLFLRLKYIERKKFYHLAL